MKSFKKTQSFSNSKRFIIGVTLFALLLTGVLVAQSYSVLPKLITSMQFIIGYALCAGAILVEISTINSNRKSYEKKVLQEFERPHVIHDFLLPKAR